MTSNVEIPIEIHSQLKMLYEEVMWLRARPNITSSVARSWYTHACSERLKKHIRRFSGFVSEASISDQNIELRLEHHLRIQAALTHLVERHHREQIKDEDEFIDLIFRYEEVHIVTREENYAAMKAKGDYEVAAIKLREWNSLSMEHQLNLWRRMLKGRVSNHLNFQPKA